MKKSKYQPRSGNVTIRLGPREVKDILEGHIFGYRNGRKIQAKLGKAVRSKFSDVEKDMAEEIQARNIRDAVQGSEEWKKIAQKFYTRRCEIDELYSSLGIEESRAMEALVQVKFNEAGVINFEAKGYGYRRKE